MSLPANVNLTPKGRQIFEYLAAHPQATLQQIMRECKVAKWTAIKWRNLWKEHQPDLTEPTPTVRRRVEAEDPLKVFPPSKKTAPSRPPAPAEPGPSEPLPDSSSDPDPDPPEPPRRKEKPDRTPKVRDVIL